MCATKGQAEALLTLINCIAGSTVESVLPGGTSSKHVKKPRKESVFHRRPHIAMVTSGRGRGKSALLGMAIATAVHSGLQRIVVTSPSLDNVGTLMEFVANGLGRCGLKEGVDFVVRRMKSRDGGGADTIVEITIAREGSRRQTVRYVAPGDSGALDEIDMMCVDETAAIPLPVVRRLLAVKCRLLFMSSTIHGYEGTGRSLSLKLMKQIREDCQAVKEKGMLLTLCEWVVSNNVMLRE